MLVCSTHGYWKWLGRQGNCFFFPLYNCVKIRNKNTLLLWLGDKSKKNTLVFFLVGRIRPNQQFINYGPIVYFTDYKKKTDMNIFRDRIYAKKKGHSVDFR